MQSIASPFVPDDCETFDVTLPPRGVPIRLTFATDEDYLAPFLMKVDPAKPIYREIPLQHHFYKSWITWIHNERLITSKGAQEILHNLQQPQERTICIEFCAMKDPPTDDCMRITVLLLTQALVCVTLT